MKSQGVRIKVHADTSELDRALEKARELAANVGGPFVISRRWDHRIGVAVRYGLVLIAGWGLGIAQASTWLKH